MSTTDLIDRPIASAWHEVAEDGQGLGLEDFLSFRIGRLNTLLQRTTTQKYLEPAGLSHAEWRVLARLAQQDWIEMRHLTRVSLMDKAAISRSVEQLLARGLAERHADPTNARRRIVAITAGGRRLVRKVLPHAMQEQAKLLRLLPAEDRAALERALNRLTQALLDDQTD